MDLFLNYFPMPTTQIDNYLTLISGILPLNRCIFIILIFLRF